MSGGAALWRRCASLQLATHCYRGCTVVQFTATTGHIRYLSSFIRVQPGMVERLQNNLSLAVNEAVINWQEQTQVLKTL